MGMISQEQFDRIAERAGDVRRRTFASGAEAAADPVDLDNLMADFEQHAAPAAKGLLGMVGKLGGMLGLEGMVAMGPDGPIRFGGEAPARELSAAPDEARLAEAERRIGRPLPPELRQLYAIGDGGFGPGGGLLGLGELVARYHELTREPYGPLGQDWPANLLPLFDEDPQLICLDLDSGGIVEWDPEEIEDEESDADWQRSFIRRQASLGELLEQWLGAPSFEEETASRLRVAMEAYARRAPSPVTGFPMELPPTEQAEGEIEFLKYSADLRDDFGLPETGWEDEVRRRHGLI